MAQLSLEEITEELDFEFFCDRESIAHRFTRGVSGDQLNIKDCPSCGDSRWRTYFGLETGRGNCFVCSQPFNKLSFIKEHFGHANWRDTIQVAKEILHEQGWRPRRQATVAVEVGEVILPTSVELPTPEGQNLQYLESRGFGADIAKYFHLRWCEFGWWKYTDPDGSVQRQTFSNRVIIPVFDLDGVLKTFQGRDLSGTSTMKYLFPKELPGTGRYLLNGQNVVATKEVALGEGFGDVAAMKIAFDQAQDLRHIVAIGSFGKHLSYGSRDGDDQLGRFAALKQRGVTTCTIMWDGGAKELEAALNAAKLLTGLGLTVRIALLPLGKDPNEVTAQTVRVCYFEAKVWTPALDLKWRLRNPYSQKSLQVGERPQG